MITSFQYDSNGFIYASVTGISAPQCDNQLVFDADTAPEIRGKLYKPSEGKVYALQKNYDGSYVLDGNDFIIDDTIQPLTIVQ